MSFYEIYNNCVCYYGLKQNEKSLAVPLKDLCGSPVEKHCCRAYLFSVFMQFGLSTPSISCKSLLSCHPILDAKCILISKGRSLNKAEVYSFSTPNIESECIRYFSRVAALCLCMWKTIFKGHRYLYSSSPNESKIH